jgi:excinuclease ABC subunit C
MDADRISQILSDLPDLPGVYRFTQNDTVIYVGKAKSLKKRVRNYFSDPDKLHSRTKKMLSIADDLHWVICKTEDEALVLERSWIQLHSPKYNISLKEAGHHPRIALSKDEYPSIYITYKENRNSELYGPWPGVDLKKVIESITLVTGIRSCDRAKFNTAKNNNRACLLKDLGKCVAPCVKSDLNYQEIVKDVRKILKGATALNVSHFQDMMLKSSEDEDFELAALWRDRIKSISYLNQTQSILQSSVDSLDVLVYLNNSPYSVVSVAKIRDGFIQSVLAYISDSKDKNQFKLEALQQAGILSDRKIPLLTDEKFDESINILIPSTQEERRLYEFVLRNATESLRIGLRESMNRSSIDESIKTLTAILELPNPAYHIECIDIAHTQGTFPVASVVSLLDGLEDGAGTRRYILPKELGGNDPGSIAWVMRRRFRIEKDGSIHRGLPDLLLIDGGLTQLRAANSVLDTLGIKLPVFGLAKKEEEIYRTDGTLVKLPINAPELLILRRARDYAHKTANTYHSTRRGKSAILSILSGIPGIGNVRQKALLDAFGSVEALANSTPSQIAMIPGFGTGTAQRVHEFLAPWREGKPNDTDCESDTVITK